jgi:hypothetical protein
VATHISNRMVLYGILAHADSLWQIARVLQVPMDSLMMLDEDETDETPHPRGSPICTWSLWMKEPRDGAHDE